MGTPAALRRFSAYWDLPGFLRVESGGAPEWVPFGETPAWQTGEALAEEARTRLLGTGPTTYSSANLIPDEPSMSDAAVRNRRRCSSHRRR